MNDIPSEKLVETKTLKSARVECWTARDLYFNCLDKEIAILAGKKRINPQQIPASQLKEIESVLSTSGIFFSFFKNKYSYFYY